MVTSSLEWRGMGAGLAADGATKRGAGLSSGAESGHCIRLKHPNLMIKGALNSPKVAPIPGSVRAPLLLAANFHDQCTCL
jgi:hypothetical protein